jgi:hypothetical protein
MSRIWQMKKQSLEKAVREYAKRSPVMNCLTCMDLGEEWRTVVGFSTKTLVKAPGRELERVGPVVLGIRYTSRFLSEAPHPFELVTVLFPSFVFHPNCLPHGPMCLGHPMPGIGMDQILHQTWAGLTFHMLAVNTELYEAANREAAAYVRDNATSFPITRKGLFETPDAAWETSGWFAPSHNGVEEQFTTEANPLPAAEDTFPENDTREQQGESHDV